ncbi:MAG: hypothetical protein WC556_01625 [Candidatus Methanoperedens sp.]
MIENKNQIDRIPVHPRNPHSISAAAVCDGGRAKVQEGKPWVSRTDI